MNKNTGIIIGVVVVLAVVIVGAMYLPMNDKNEATPAVDAKMIDEQIETENKIENMMQDASKGEGNTVMNNDETGGMDQSDMLMQAGSYEAYSADKLARAETGDVVLFFHASWCPSCRGLNANIESNINAIPAGVTILKVDYDKETELKKKYRITTQHTLVHVDAAGAMLKKWSGGSTLDTILSNIQ